MQSDSGMMPAPTTNTADRMMKPATRHLVAAAVLLLSGTVHAERPAFGDTLTIGFGGMNHYADSTFRSTTDGRPPINLDMDDLGMDQRVTTIWAGVTWQFADSWGISANYATFDSDGEISADKNGNFGDIAWQVNARLESDMSLDLYIIDLHWNFINSDRTSIGAGVGVHIADFEANISATATGELNGSPITSPVDLGSETAGITAPMPNVFLRASHRFAENWVITGTAGYFSLEYDDVEGDLISARAALKWRPGGGRFGGGLGYQYVSIDVTDAGGSKTETYDIQMYGPILFLEIGF